MLKKKIIITAFLLSCVLNGLFAAAGESAATRRFGIFIGSNNGGRDRAMLRYAVSDAKSVSRVFSTMGGISATDNILLVEPTSSEINRQLDNIGRLATQSRRNAQRTELVFYYSGHSDENGILLNRERYGYRELRSRIDSVQSDMRIVILDSCSSGAITRAKGGTKTQPFLFDSSVSTVGYAILTSSSADETSQESDSIESSYFTHSLLAGLRGAADSVGDRRVTLNELYRFAYSETLEKTETSMYGAQHPSYDIQVSGTGDVVLTDIREISASLLIHEDITGRISIRDNYDFLVAELTKVTRKPLELGLEPGMYRITLQRGDSYFRTEVTLPENRQTALGMEAFQVIAAAPGGVRRGDSPVMDSPVIINGGANNSADVPVYPVNLQFLPGYNMVGPMAQKSTNNLLVGLFIGIGHNLNGIGAAWIGLINNGSVRGIQGSGTFNMAYGFIEGIQGTGIFNYAADDIRGIQGSGVLNITGGNIKGIQGTGIFNYTGGDFLGLQGSGIANFNAGSVKGIQGTGIFNFVGVDFLGIQGSGIANFNVGSVKGIQGTGIFNFAGGNLTGMQGAGIVNYSGGTLKGLQGAGILNYAGGMQGAQMGLVNILGGGNETEKSRGAQFGLVNISRSEDIVPFGLVNIMKSGILHPAVYVDDMRITNCSFRSGSKHFYTILSGGTDLSYLTSEDTDWLLSTRAGFGFEIPIKKFFIDIDAAAGNIYQYNASEMNDGFSRTAGRFIAAPEAPTAPTAPTMPAAPESPMASFFNKNTTVFQIRLSAGFKPLEHFGVFGGVSYDYFYRWNDDSPVPANFGEFLPIVNRGPNTHKIGLFGGIQF
jgi:hypothetical protein